MLFAFFVRFVSLCLCYITCVSHQSSRETLWTIIKIYIFGQLNSGLKLLILYHSKIQKHGVQRVRCSRQVWRTWRRNQLNLLLKSEPRRFGELNWKKVILLYGFLVFLLHFYSELFNIIKRPFLKVLRINKAKIIFLFRCALRNIDVVVQVVLFAQIFILSQKVIVMVLLQHRCHQLWPHFLVESFVRLVGHILWSHKDSLA